MSTVAVTGATGTLGTRLVQQLASREDVHVVALDADLNDGPAVGDFLAACQPTHVLHLGAVVDLSRVDGDEDRVMATNVGGTAHVGQAVAALATSPWVFYASSSHVYADSTDPLIEGDPVGPRNFYGLTKLLGEHTIAHFCRLAGAPLCVGRIFSLFDERQTGGFLLPGTARRIADSDPDSPVEVPNGGSVRDFSHARDLAAAIVALMDARATGTVNIGSGRGMRVVDLLAQTIAPPRTFVPAPGDMVDTIVADTRLFQELTAHDR